MLYSPWLASVPQGACSTCQAEMLASMSWVVLVLALILPEVDPAHSTLLGAVVHVVPIESHGGERVSTLCCCFNNNINNCCFKCPPTPRNALECYIVIYYSIYGYETLFFLYGDETL